MTLRTIDVRVAALDDRTTASLRGLRRELSRELHDAPAADVLRLAASLVARDGPADRFLAYELVASHVEAMSRLSMAAVRRLGRGIDSWGDVDMFACLVAGPAWRAGRITDREVAGWANSKDRWWRRAAVVSTVPLNSRARGGDVDARRTLDLCGRLVRDRDPMVVKAVSWALRELGKRDEASVERFLSKHDTTLAPLIVREVRHKLATGLKAPRRPRPASSI